MFRKTIRKDEGFTLIELLIVVAIIAILAAIAIPQFQKYKYRANKASVESDLKNAYTASQVYLTDNPTATVDSLAKLQAGGWVKSADTLFNGTPTMTLSAGNIKLYSVTLNGAAKQNIAGMEFNGTVTSNTILASSF